MIGLRQRSHDAGVGKLQQDAVSETFLTLALVAAEDEHFILQESRETSAVESHPEIFRRQAQHLNVKPTFHSTFKLVYSFKIHPFINLVLYSKLETTTEGSCDASCTTTTVAKNIKQELSEISFYN